ncbi:MAG: hypothetical protein KBC84_01205 [Proteobacteria bacterium]|nr:hypothetical protein [Pseudomonadota bacterium]
MFGNGASLIGFNPKPKVTATCSALFYILLLCSGLHSCSSNQSELSSQNIALHEKEIKTDTQLEQVGSNWFYGQGIGKTTLNVGTAIAFPPYLIYLVGNAGLSLAGYQPLSISGILPEDSKNFVDKVYDETTSVPGRITSGVAGVEYKSK